MLATTEPQEEEENAAMKRKGKGMPYLTMVLAFQTAVTIMALATTRASAVPHRLCLNDSRLVLAFAIPDAIIGTTYLIMSTYLIRYAISSYRKGGEVASWAWMYLSFASFILSCGLTHYFDVVTLWLPWYRLSAAVRLACAAFSVATCVIVPALLRSVRVTKRGSSLVVITREDKYGEVSNGQGAS